RAKCRTPTYRSPPTNPADRATYVEWNAKPSQPYSPCELGAQVESGGYNNDRDSYCLNRGLQRTQSPASRRVSAAGRRSEGFGSFRQGSRGQKSPDAFGPRIRLNK